MPLIRSTFASPWPTMLVVILLGLLAGGCSGGPGESEPETTGESVMVAPRAEGEAVAALSGLEAADEAAVGWQEDAGLYAVAAATPTLNAEGESPSWLYTYVSESAGAVASVTYSEAEGARLDPAQELPEADITYISDNLLPKPASLTDSTEAIEAAREVGSALEENPEAEASAGLDSFSGNGPEWIFATAQGEERIEERVPATTP